MVTGGGPVSFKCRGCAGENVVPVVDLGAQPCADYFPTRDRALLAHATQVAPASAWFAVPLEVHQAAWPTEDY